MNEHLRSCEICFHQFMHLSVMRRKFPIIIDLDELAGMQDWHLEGEELEAYLYGEMEDELDIDCANLHLEDCDECRIKVRARIRELEELGRAVLQFDVLA